MFPAQTSGCLVMNKIATGKGYLNALSTVRTVFCPEYLFWEDIGSGFLGSLEDERTPLGA